jgi:co-chaperonin GroES (HSP10)
MGSTEITHDTLREYFVPKNNSIMIEFIETVKTAGGVLLPTPEKSIAYQVIATGPKVDPEVCKPGDWVTLGNVEVGYLKLLNAKVSLVKDYDVLMVVNMDYLAIEMKLKEEAKQRLIEKNKNSNPNQGLISVN